MTDNEIIKEIRATREKLLEECGHDIDKFFEGIMERQKDLPNLVSPAPKGRTLAEDKPAKPYNKKN